MNCKDFEQDIYLYSELPEAERIPVDVHIKTCVTCKELFQAVSAAQKLINTASVIKPELSNHGRLTSNIMQAIQSKPQKESTLVYRLQRSFVKYSFVVASLMLIILFVVEQQASVESEKPVIAGTVTLKSTSVANVLDQQNKPSLSLYACIKSENCNNALVENLKQKHF